MMNKKISEREHNIEMLEVGSITYVESSESDVFQKKNNQSAYNVDILHQ